MARAKAQDLELNADELASAKQVLESVSQLRQALHSLEYLSRLPSIVAERDQQRVELESHNESLSIDIEAKDKRIVELRITLERLGRQFEQMEHERLQLQLAIERATDELEDVNEMLGRQRKALADELMKDRDA